MQFVRIIVQGPGDAFFNMALDEAISEAVRRKLSPPTLRLYEWSRPSLSIGYFQRTSDIDVGYCRKMGYPVVRRLTGGRAVLHDSELTYSFAASADFTVFRGSLREDYMSISRALVLMLRLNGIDAEASFERRGNAGRRSPACFRALSYGEITARGRKIIGSAQRRYPDGFMQHGSVLLSFDARQLCNVTGHDEEDFRGIGALRDYAPGISINDLKNSFKEAFGKELGVKMISDDPAEFEMDTAKELEKNKYSSGRWNFRR